MKIKRRIGLKAFSVAWDTKETLDKRFDALAEHIDNGGSVVTKLHCILYSQVLIVINAICCCIAKLCLGWC